jgi:NAD(P)-dependent dehydrogenase (short-subunit alcohol dehydrogenase family)
MPSTELPEAALVTGAALRIGCAVAFDLAAQGWRVAVHYRSSAEAAERLAADITAQGGTAEPVQADLAQERDVARLVRRCVDRLGPTTLLVNNAALFEQDDLGTLDFARWEKQLNVNLRAPVFLAQAFAKALPSGKTGSIVNMVDQCVVRPGANFLSYTIAKSGLWAATQMLAKALAPRIRVNAIGPGPVLPSPWQTQAEFEAEYRSTPLGRGSTPEEICGAIRFLLETPSITGQMILLDGGQHLA